MTGVTFGQTVFLTLLFIVFCVVLVLDTSNRSVLDWIKRKLFKRKRKHKSKKVKK